MPTDTVSQLPVNLDKWRTKQVNAAIERGINALDATQAVDAFLSVLPAGADPNAYIVPTYALEQGAPVDSIADLRADWYADEGVAPRYKRLLDARGVE